MFENHIFQVSVDTKKWAKAAGIRAVKTMAQAAIAGIGTAAVLGEVHWTWVFSAAALAGILSLLTSVAGIPEVQGKGRDQKEQSFDGSSDKDSSQKESDQEEILS